MRKAHRLVGWWLVCVATGFLSRAAHAQSTATFPEEPAPGKAPARPTPPPAAPPRAPTPPPAARPIPSAPSLPPVAETPYTPQASPQYHVPELPTPGRDARPPILPFEEGLPVPAGYEVVDRPNTGLTTAGAIGFAASYGAGVIVGATQGFKNGAGWILVPLIGPWVAIGTRKYQCGSSKNLDEAKKCVNSAVGEVQMITFLAVDGIAQLATSFITIAGLVSSKKALLRTDLLPAQVSVVPPGPGHDGWGISARGQF